MAEQPDGQPEHTDPEHTDPDPAGPDDTGSNNSGPGSAASASDEDPRGLLFISDLQALRRADTVRVHAADGVGVIDASLTTLAGDQPRIYTATEQRLFPEPVGHQRRRRIAVAADIAGFDTATPLARPPTARRHRHRRHRRRATARGVALGRGVPARRRHRAAALAHRHQHRHQHRYRHGPAGQRWSAPRRVAHRGAARQTDVDVPARRRRRPVEPAHGHRPAHR